jgi:hypothetical protein
LLIDQVPTSGVQIFALDASAWPRAQARTLPDRGYVYSATSDVTGSGVFIGHHYSALAWVCEAGTSWALPLWCDRIETRSDAITCGLNQLRQLCQQYRGERVAVVADSDYGNTRFLGPAAALIQASDVALALLVRLRSNRVLYRDPPPYQGRGAPRKHGPRFDFRDEDTWPEPDETTQTMDARLGQCSIQCWHRLHAGEDAYAIFTVLRAQIHQEREHPPRAAWFAYLSAKSITLDAEAIWRLYPSRASVEAMFRFRKNQLAWTKPGLGSISASQRWTRLVTMAQWILYLARDRVLDQALPWQRKQTRLGPYRVKQSLGGLFVQLDTPAKAPKPRGKSPGWTKGRQRQPRIRHPVVRKGQKPRQKRRKKA